MATQSEADRLSQIRTHWSEIFEAHQASHDASETLYQLVNRYIGAVHRYILGAVGDPDSAEDLCQEFAVRFLRGDFRNANPNRGRFRDYVRTVVINLVNDAHRARQASPVHLSEFQESSTNAALEEEGDDFGAVWREELIARTWDALQQCNPLFHAVLRLRVEEPDSTSTSLAARLAVQFGRPITGVNVRKSLERAHAKFAELLFEEVGTSLGTSNSDDIEAELRALDLFRYCRSAWERRKTRSRDPLRRPRPD